MRGPERRKKKGHLPIPKLNYDVNIDRDKRGGSMVTIVSIALQLHSIRVLK
jgi:hypothetical protein